MTRDKEDTVHFLRKIDRSKNYNIRVLIPKKIDDLLQNPTHVVFYIDEHKHVQIYAQ